MEYKVLEILEALEDQRELNELIQIREELEQQEHLRNSPSAMLRKSYMCVYQCSTRKLT